MDLSKPRRNLEVNPPMLAEAPWTLTGFCYTLVCKFPSTFLAKSMFIDEFEGASTGGYGVVMFVHYDSSNVGPYDELLFLPLRKRTLDSKRRFRARSISRIFVSSEASVQSGRQNWGIPKERANFELTERSSGRLVTVIRPETGALIAQFEVRARGPRFPFNARLLPRAWRRLGQVLQDEVFEYIPKAKGNLRLAQMDVQQVESQEFPDFSQGRPLVCLEYSDFEMMFPVAESWALSRPSRPEDNTH